MGGGISFKITEVKQEDLGFRLARSRNNGARASKGEFLIFMDQDLIFPNDFIEKIYKARAQKRMLISVAIWSSKEEKEEIMPLIGQDYANIINKISQKKLKENKRIIFKNNLNNILYALKLRPKGMKMVGYFFALYKEDFININGFDENFIGWGEEDDDFYWRFYKYGGEIKCVVPDYPIIHIFHPFASSKGQGPNKDYYYKRRKEYSKFDFKPPKFGFDKTLGDDEFKINIIKN